MVGDGETRKEVDEVGGRVKRKVYVANNDASNSVERTDNDASRCESNNDASGYESENDAVRCESDNDASRCKRNSDASRFRFRLTGKGMPLACRPSINKYVLVRITPSRKKILCFK